jgi:cytochrome c556
MRLKILLPLLVAGLALTGCDRVDPNSPLGKRKSLFNEMLGVSEDLGGMLRGRLPFEPEAFQLGAERLDRLAHEPWQHFPQVADTDGSAARDEVWQRQARFQELARELEAATGELLVASREAPKDKRRLRPAVQKVEDRCEGCHQEFRIY